MKWKITGADRETGKLMLIEKVTTDPVAKPEAVEYERQRQAVVDRLFPESAERAAGFASCAQSKEVVFFETPSFLVTQHRVLIENKTYAVANIGAVEVVEIEREVNGTLMAMGGILGIVGIPLVSLNIWQFGATMIGLGLIMIIIPLIVAYMHDSEYCLRISSGSGDSDILKSRSRATIGALADAIAKAIIEHGK
jgi:Family of unknown function (DUF6232)